MKGNKKREKGSSTLSTGNSNVFRKESAGVVYGLSERSDFDALASSVPQDTTSNPMAPGYTTQRVQSRKVGTVKEKGNTFEIC